MSQFKQKKIDPDLSWQTASGLLKNTLHFSSSFTTTIRALKQNEAENLANGSGPYKLNPGAKFSAMRLFKAGSIKAPLYYLTATFNPQALEEKKYLSTEDLAALYTVEELAAILALTYIFNSLRKVCDKEEWIKYAKLVNENVEIGGYMGKNLQGVGFAGGILLSGVRCLAPAVYLARNPKMFKNYKRDMKIKKVSYDLEMEYELFGCTHVDIATQMLQSVGFGVDISTDFYKSLVTSPSKSLEVKPNGMRIMLLWVEALYMGRKPPSIHGENEIMLSEDVLDQLLIISKQVQESGSAFSWLSKGKSSISKQLAPILYNSKNTADVEEEPDQDEEQASV